MDKSKDKADDLGDDLYFLGWIYFADILVIEED
jgi:hypothetical protein